MSEDKDREEELFNEIDEDAQGDKYLLCKIGNEVYGINIIYVTDIIELQEITEVPDMPPYVQGVINLRGNVIPVIDLRIRFGMEAKEYDDRTVITVVKIDEASIGFIVDTATEVKDIPEKNIDPPPGFRQSGGAEKRYLSGLGKVDDQVIILLDIQSLATGEELESIKAHSPQQ
jgi:purine-binding chemotaxis protein CheW